MVAKKYGELWLRCIYEEAEKRSKQHKKKFGEERISNLELKKCVK